MDYKHNVIKYRLEKSGGEYERLLDENMESVIENSIETDKDLRTKRTGTNDLESTVINDSFDKIENVDAANSQKKLTQQNTKLRDREKTIARRFLSKTGKGIETSTTLFSFAQGGADIAAGDDIIDKAESLKNSGAISSEEYDIMIRNGQLRLAQGSFGLANGVKDVGEFVGKRLMKKISEKAGTATGKLLQQSVRFAPVVGSIISIGTTATSLAKNAIAAHDAVQSDNTGKAVMYSIIAAIDVVTLILDGASLVADFVFLPLSPILDLISTVLQVVNIVLGFFADLFDFRSTKQKVTDEFNTYINSDAFKKYVDDMAEVYKQRGFDVFTYTVDAEVAGVDKGDRQTRREVSKDINKCLTDKAKEDFNNPQLRIALLDATSTGKTLRGRLNNDEIVAGFGPDKIFGEDGDDMLFGRGGDDTIYGGPGNDYLNGGTGRDILLGGAGDDVVNCEPAVDLRCEGGEGDDTLELSGESLIYDDKFFKAPYITMGKQWELNPAQVSPVKGIYLDMRHAKDDTKQGMSGISLGSLFQGWPGGYNSSIHKPAMPKNSALETQFNQFARAYSANSLGNWREELKDKLLWLLVDTDSKKIFYDGNNLYTVHFSAKTIRSVTRCSDCFQNLDTQYAVYKNDRLQYTNNKKIQALLTFAFKRSFSSDKFEKVSGSAPEDITNPAHYIPTTIIGDNEDNVIDLSYGLGDVVYTNGGNNVVSVGTTMPNMQVNANGIDDRGFKFAKYIVGGSGDNTLIIQYMKTPESCTSSFKTQAWNLLDLDGKNSPLQSVYMNGAHKIYAKNMKTIVVSPPPRDCSNSFVSLRAKHYTGSTRFILDKIKYFEGPAFNESTCVTVLLKSLKGEFNRISFGDEAMNTISLKYYSDSEYKVTKIDIGTHTNGIISASCVQKGKCYNVVDNARNVIGTSSCKEIIGNNKANLLMAFGGETTVEAKDGDDTLVSARGRHVLKGGEGADTYVIHGPNVKDVLTISVVMGGDSKTITCKTAIFGKWKPQVKRLEIDILQEDHNEVLLTSAEIVPAKGDENKNLGSLSIDSAKRKLIFVPGDNFNYLKRNRAKVIRVSFTTTGSIATINETDYGNILRFESVRSFNDLKISMVSDQLVLKDQSDNVVMVDKMWKRLESKTNLLDHILDFAQRFPSILFKTSSGSFNRYSTKETVRIIYEQLKHIETELGQDYDSYIDSTKLPSNTGDEIYVGNGENIVFAKTRGKKYVLGNRATNGIIYANNFVDGSGRVEIETRLPAERPSPRPINTVVVGSKSKNIVELRKVDHNIIITDASPEDVRFYKCGPGNEHICARKVEQGRNRTLLVLKTSKCHKLIFNKGENVTIIMNCNDYLKSKTGNDDNKPAWPIIVSYGAQQEYKLTLPINKSESSIIIWPHPHGNMVTVYFKKTGGVPYTGKYWRSSYLLIPTQDEMPKQIDTKVLVNALTSRFKGGIEFAGNDYVTNDGICQLVVDLVKRHPPTRFTLTNQNLRCQGS